MLAEDGPSKSLKGLSPFIIMAVIYIILSLIKANPTAKPPPTTKSKTPNFGNPERIFNAVDLILSTAAV